jgi:hypothetical protein
MTGIRNNRQRVPKLRFRYSLFVKTKKTGRFCLTYGGKDGRVTRIKTGNEREEYLSETASEKGRTVKAPCRRKRRRLGAGSLKE